MLSVAIKDSVRQLCTLMCCYIMQLVRVQFFWRYTLSTNLFRNFVAIQVASETSILQFVSQYLCYAANKNSLSENSSQFILNVKTIARKFWSHMNTTFPLSGKTISLHFTKLRHSRKLFST